MVAAKKTYDVYNDPGHGWCKVERVELIRLGIYDTISHFSYVSRDGKNVFLEEDCDMARFIEAKQKFGERFKFRDHHTNRQSRIRKYPPLDAYARGVIDKYFGCLVQ